MTELSLPETVIALQRLDLRPETREVVEEAARLLQDGREMEARALVEKAEALAAAQAPVNGKHNGNGRNANGYNNGFRNGNGDTRWAGVMLAPIAEKLANGFTAVLTSVLEDIYQHTGDQVQVVATVLEERISGIEENLQRTSGFEERLESLAMEQHALRQAQDETSSAIDMLNGAGLESRIAAVEERVTGIDQMVRELQPQMGSVLTRLDRHTDALRFLEQRHSQRVSALNRVLENLSSLREEEPVPEPSLPLM